MAHHTSRPRASPMGNEEASSILNLGEFENTHTLSLSAARLLINAITRKQHSINPSFKESQTLTKTQDWLDTFSKFQGESEVTQLEQMLVNTPGLEGFERSQLGSLVPTDADEAKTMIPSLANKITDEELKDLCDQMEELRQAAERDAR